MIDQLYCGPECGYREALETIVGPADSGPFIEAYRAAGGGYAGLQAIARKALGREPELREGYCKHGVYVGGMGIDWLCGECEDGDE